jgi:putative Mn2+ efflux pump MntP
VDVFSIVLTGIALAMDAFAVTIANCTTYKNKLNKKQEFSMPIAFTFFQMLMPILGFYIGSVFAKYISAYAGYVTAGVFFILSLKIVYDNVKDILNAKKGISEENEDKTSFTILVLIIQALSTSIDALIVGVTFSTQLASPFIPALIIGATTFILVCSALLFGKYLGKLFSKYACWIGAVILFALAVKNLVTAIIG